jgi:hypothetical protein
MMERNQGKMKAEIVQTLAHLHFLFCFLLSAFRFSLHPHSPAARRDAAALPANILLIGAHLVCQLTPDFFYDFRLTKQGK